MERLLNNEAVREPSADNGLSASQHGRKEALNRAALDAQQRLGRLLLEGPLSPELAGLVMQLILKVRDLHIEMIEIQRPPRDPRDAPVFAEI